MPLLLPASAKMLMTCLKVNRDLFISILYFANFPYVPVIPILSEPAKSTNYILLHRRWLGLEWWKLSTLKVNIEWLLDDCTLSLCAELILFFKPYKKYLVSSSWSLHSKTNKFYTENCSSLFHLSLNPFTFVPTFLEFSEAGFSKSNIFSL